MRQPHKPVLRTLSSKSLQLAFRDASVEQKIPVVHRAACHALGQRNAGKVRMQKFPHHLCEFIPATILDCGVRFDLLLQSVRRFLRCRIVSRTLIPTGDFHIPFGHVDIPRRILRRLLAFCHKPIKELASLAADFGNQRFVSHDFELDEFRVRAVIEHKPAVLCAAHHQLMLKLYAIEPSGSALKPLFSNIRKRRFTRTFDFHGLHCGSESIKGGSEKSILVKLSADGHHDFQVFELKERPHLVFVFDAKAHQRV